MNKKNITFWLLYAALLVFLYILSATDLIIKENETEVYSISVLVEGISGENLENMKKGMDEAAYEYNVDLSFPAIAENITLEEKTEIAEDEIEAGAKAIIIGNRRKKEVAAEIKKRHPELPVLILGTVGDTEEADSISLNYKELVKILSENIRAAESINNEICIIKDNSEDEDMEELSKELGLRLENMGYKLSFAEGNGPSLEKQLKNFNKDKIVFVPLDKESAVRVVKYAEDSNLANEITIYTVGATDYLLGKLEDGEISGMIGWNEYDMGYFTIEKLIKMLTDKSGTGKDEIEVFYITGEDLKNENYIKILYPIGG